MENKIKKYIKKENGRRREQRMKNKNKLRTFCQKSSIVLLQN